MANRDKLIAAQAIVKSLIEAGRTHPDEEFEIDAQQFLKMVERLAGGPIEDAPVARSVGCLSEVGGANAPAPVTTGGNMRVSSLEDRGKFVRVQVERDGRSIWASAWDTDADKLRSAGQGAMISAEVKDSGKHVNLKKVTVVSGGGGASDIPF